MPIVFEFANGVLGKKIIEFCQWFCFLFRYYLSWNGHEPSFAQIWIPFTQECFVTILVGIGRIVLEEKLFRFLPCILAISLLFSLPKSLDPSIELTWIPFLEGCFMARLVKIGLVVRRKWFSRQCIFAIPLFTPFGNDRGPYLNKFVSPLPRHALCQDWLELVQ